MKNLAPVRVLFVCLGNICRSPSAHGVFRSQLARSGLIDRVEVASAGTGDWHIGKAPDRRATAAAARGTFIDDRRAPANALGPRPTGPAAPR